MSKATPALYLIRHGLAEDHNAGGDAARGLTSEGRAELRAHVRGLRKRMSVRGIATSPFARAVQTAEIMADGLHVDEIEVNAALAISDRGGASVVQLARELGPGWALVGHNPSIAEAMALLTGDRKAQRFHKGCVAALQPVGDGDAWSLAWMATPGEDPP